MDAIDTINAGAAKHIKRASADRWTPWARWADGTHVTGDSGMIGPDSNRQMIAWKRQGACAAGHTRDAA